MKQFIILCALWVGLATTGHGQLLLPSEKGTGRIDVAYSSMGDYTFVFPASGKGSYPLERKIADRTLTLQGEWGVGKRISLVAILPIKFLSSDTIPFNPTVFLTEIGSFTTLGNVTAGIRYTFLGKSVALYGQLMVETPTSCFDDRTGLRGGFDAVSIMPSVTLGKKWTKFYLSTTAGMAFRTNTYSHDVRLAMEGGYRIMKGFYVAGVFNTVLSLKNGSRAGNKRELETRTYLNNRSLVSLGLKVTIGFAPHWGVSGLIYGYLYGIHVAQYTGFGIRVYYQW